MLAPDIRRKHTFKALSARGRVLPRALFGWVIGWHGRLGGVGSPGAFGWVIGWRGRLGGVGSLGAFWYDLALFYK